LPICGEKHDHSYRRKHGKRSIKNNPGGIKKGLEAKETLMML
jgi:hypothetical protein